MFCLILSLFGLTDGAYFLPCDCFLFGMRSSNHQLSLAYRNALFDLNQVSKREEALVEMLKVAQAESECKRADILSLKLILIGKLTKKTN